MIGRARFGRRGLLRAGAGVATAAGAPRARAARKRIALVATCMWKYSHAQHFADRFLEGYGWEGRHHRPPLDLVSMYIDQFPANDLARERAARFGVKLAPTIAEALTLGGRRLAVDGVVIVGEHGEYPRNDRGQKLYPRHRFFKEVVRVFEASGRAVPVFSDKHLSTRWSEAAEMAADARRLRFPFIAGSSLPVTWRLPAVDLPAGAPLDEGVVVAYGGVDAYDIHAIELAQAVAERRRGGESGVRAVQALRGPAVWSWLRARPATERLVLQALGRSHTLTPPPGYTAVPPTIEWAARAARDPIAYCFEHRDGLRTTMLLLDGLVLDFDYAGRLGDGSTLAFQAFLPMPPRQTTLADFFNPLAHAVEEMIVTGRAPYPIERNLLTTGMTAFAIESLHRGGARLETPELAVAYHGPAASSFWRT